MKTKTCKTCIVRATCTKDYHENSICEDANNELAYNLYLKHKSWIVLERYKYVDMETIFNNEAIKYIKFKQKRRRPPKQFRKSTLKVIERKLKEITDDEIENLLRMSSGREFY